MRPQPVTGKYSRNPLNQVDGGVLPQPIAIIIDQCIGNTAVDVIETVADCRQDRYGIDNATPIHMNFSEEETMTEFENENGRPETTGVAPRNAPLSVVEIGTDDMIERDSADIPADLKRSHDGGN